ncbi:hypothetical protein [Natronosalvus rutilus]|uniref:Uncharacterized protein n=1 Tax=Natronosalvus rutilus TaxID=2953753 RepID=A0A9E7N820_9EURY|nr:hypothetical protein [Natronosalvus rutilus]UTF53175.1 hypothetical protein NGM29_15580 [Natronosalvus rutilus]
MASPQAVLDRFADDVPYAPLADSFRSFDRPAGDEPLSMLATATAATDGGSATTSVVETVEETFLERGEVTSFSDVADLEPDDERLHEVFHADRKRRVFCEVAHVLANRPERSDIEALCSWAAEADVYRYDLDPVGDVSGVGPTSFQYLRQLAGIDTARPNAALESLLKSVAHESETAVVETSEPLRTLASCEWLSLTTTYRPLEIDRLAWWLEASDDKRARAVDPALE